MLTLVTGGCRSGKTAYGQSLLPEGPKTYLATGLICDREMADRVAKHRFERGAEWRTVEAGPSLPETLNTLSGPILVDSVTAWVAEVMGHTGPRFWLPVFDDLLSACTAASKNCQLVLVTDEVGLGVVPATASGRRFRDLLGALNQKLAELSQAVYLVSCGLPLKLK